MHILSTILATLGAVGAQAGAQPTEMVRSGEAGTAAEAVVQRQLEAYNAHDLEAFAAAFADDIEIRRYPDEVLNGKETLKKGYQGVFERLKPKARVVHRTVMGDRIADVETLRIGATEHCCAVAIYQVKDGLIRRMDLISSPNFARPKKP